MPNILESMQQDNSITPEPDTNSRVPAKSELSQETNSKSGSNEPSNIVGSGNVADKHLEEDKTLLSNTLPESFSKGFQNSSRYLFSSESSELSDLTDSEAETEKMNYSDKAKTDYPLDKDGEFKSHLMELARKDISSGEISDPNDTVSSIKDDQLSTFSDAQDTVHTAATKDIELDAKQEQAEDPSMLVATQDSGTVVIKRVNDNSSEEARPEDSNKENIPDNVEVKQEMINEAIKINGKANDINETLASEDVQESSKTSAFNGPALNLLPQLSNKRKSDVDESASDSENKKRKTESPKEEQKTDQKAPETHTDNEDTKEAPLEPKASAEADVKEHHDDQVNGQADEEDAAEEEEEELEEEEEEDEEDTHNGNDSLRNKVRPKEDEASIQKKQEDEAARQKHRKEAIEKLTEIEIEFARLKDKLYEDKLKTFESEIQMCINGSHPALKSVYEKIENHRNKKLTLVQNRQKYHLLCIDRQTRAQRLAIHQQYLKEKSEIKMNILNDTTVQWYDINRDRKLMNTITPEYSYRVSRHKQDQINQASLINHELEALNMVSQQYGFPVASKITSSTADEINEDLSALGII